MTLESTPAQKKAFSTFYAGQRAGTNKPMVDTASQRHDGGLAAIKAKLAAGPTAPSDQPTPGDHTDAAPAGVDRDVWAKAQASAADPQSPDYALAFAFLDLAQQFADLQAGGQP
jgi:hypothetical protein